MLVRIGISMMKDKVTSKTSSSADRESLRQRVEKILELIRPSIQEDGGDVELVDISDDGVVMVKFLGACIDCPSSSQTLKMGIERNLKEHIPEVTQVRSVS